jgi:hypothetical protein
VEGKMTRQKEGRKNKRIEVKQVVEVMPDSEKKIALSFDVSTGGLQFKTKEPIRVWLRIGSDNTDFTREAQLVWAKRDADGSMRYGLEYIEK